jgi:hypothetical protein
MDYYEPLVLMSAYRYVGLLRKLDVNGSLAVSYSLLEARNTKLKPTRNFSEHYQPLEPYGQDSVRPDPIVVPSHFSGDVKAFVRLMRPAVEQFWRAYGNWRATCFDDKTGDYKPSLDEWDYRR